MKFIALSGLLPTIILAFVCGCSESQPHLFQRSPESKAAFSADASIELSADLRTVDLNKVPQGAVRFTASIKNEGRATITIAHPAICEPVGYNRGTRYFSESHGKSEILLKITKPKGDEVVLRDGYMHYFDPDNIPAMIIPPNGIGTFSVGWFFENARGRWERDDVAAKVFLAKGKYAIRILFRNIFPKARLYDEETEKVALIDVWTGFMESPEIIIEVK